MKKLILILIGSFLIAGGAYAQNNRPKTEIKINQPVSRQIENGGVIGEFTHNGQTFKIKSPENRELKAHTRAEELAPVITEAPGTMRYYSKDVVGYGQALPIIGYGVACSINWDGDDAYFLNIITAAPMDSYVKATKTSPTRINLPMHQMVKKFEDEEYDIALGLLRTIVWLDGSDQYIWFDYSDDYDSVDYSIAANGSIELINPDATTPPTDGEDPKAYGMPDYVIGYYYTDDFSWAFFCDVYQIFDEFNFERVIMPEGLPSTTYTYINRDREGVIVTVAEDSANETLYFKGLSAYAPEAVFKGEIVENGKKLSVAPNQFVGFEGGLYYIITSTVTLEDNGQYVPDDQESAMFILTRDDSGKIISISADPDSPYFLAFNDDPFYFWDFDTFENLDLTLQEEFPGVPATPQGAYYEDYSATMGANFIFFRLSAFSKDGAIIDVNNLYYSIFLNGDPLEFEQTDGQNLLDEDIVMYNGIKNPTYFIPYTFANDVDLYEDNGGTFIVALYAEGIDEVGVQGVYFYDDVISRGDMVTIDVATGEETVTPGYDTGVRSFRAEDVVGVEYYDLQGRRLDKRGQGLMVKRYKLADGTSRSVKVLVR
ncbi:MAG: hypothetical protein J1D77_02165 [Muribaculaceae bacterium]|nr:hypothetical protein [Muribaculaceae bacterium]